MSDKNNNGTLWVVGFVVGLGVLLWIVTQCSLSCASNQKENWGGAHVQAGRSYSKSNIRHRPGDKKAITKRLTAVLSGI